MQRYGSHVTGRLPVYDMWRRKTATAYGSARQQRRRVGADGTLAVGAGNVYGLPWKVDVLEEKANPLEARLDHGRLSGQHERRPTVWMDGMDVLKRRVTVCLQTAVTQTGQWMKSKMEEATRLGDTV